MIPVIYRNQAHPYNRWRYEGLITLTNPPAVEDFQVQATVLYQPGMSGGFSDLRFADVYGNVIPYWIESKTDGSAATVWVKIPNKDSSIFFYWGNELAVSESDGDAVFDFFDDFSGSALDTAKWTVRSGYSTPSVSGGVATLPSGKDGIYIISKNNAPNNCAVSARIRRNGSGTSVWSSISVRDQDHSSYPYARGYMFTYYSESKSNPKTILFRSSGSAITNIGTGGATPDNTYIIFNIVANGNTLLDSGNGVSASDSTYSSGKIGLGTSALNSTNVDWVMARKYTATEPIVTIALTGTNRHFRRVVIVDTAIGGEADTISFATSLAITPTEPSLFLTADALSFQSNVQLASTVSILDRIPVVSALNLASTFDRMRSFGDISALASESVDISKSINDTMWVLTTTVRGDSPAEFFHYAYETEDHTGTDQIIFTGFTPDTVNRHTALQNQSDVVMYDYGWYLSAQYLPDDALVINLSGSRTTWAEWIRYLLEGTGITPYRIATSSADDKEFNFTARTTKRDAIDTISKYCGFVFVVGWNTSTPPDPVAYWIDQEDIDDPSNGLDLPAVVTVTWPDPHLVDIPSVQGTPEEKINRVRIRGNDTSGNWYSATIQTPALATGEEIAREYYEESSAWNSQAKVNARAQALYNYFTTTTYTVEAKFLKRMDLRLYQKIRFQGSGFSSKLTVLGWLRIIEINYHIAGIEKYVTIRAVTDKGQMSLLLERMNYAAGGTISDIGTIVSNQISAIPMTEVGTVLSINGDIATVQTESGKIVQARVIL